MLYGREYTNIRYTNDSKESGGLNFTSPTSSMHGSTNSLYASLARSTSNQPTSPIGQNTLPVVNRDSKRISRPVSDAHLPR